MNVRMGSLAAGMGAVLMLAAGCGSDPPAASGGGPATGAATSSAVPRTTGGRPADTAEGPACPTPATMGSPLGMTLKEPRVSRFSDYVVVCSYDGKRADGKSGSVLLRLETGYTAAKFADAKPRYAPGVPMVGQSGVGDEAVSFTQTVLGTDVVSLVVRVGDVSVFVGAPATLDQEKALIKALFPS